MDKHMEAIRRLQAQAMAVEQSEMENGTLEHSHRSQGGGGVEVDFTEAEGSLAEDHTDHSGDDDNETGSAAGASVQSEAIRPKKPFELVEKETNNVLCLRYMILVQVLLLCCFLGYGTFAFVGKAEENDDDGNSSLNVILTAVVAVGFVILLCTFLVYDFMVEKRQDIVVSIATKSTAIVDGLFPAQVRDRMMNGTPEMAPKNDNQSVPPGSVADLTSQADVLSNGNALVIEPGKPKSQSARSSESKKTELENKNLSVKQFLAENGMFSDTRSTQPIADLFPNTTVIFADIAGFTAWSSQRDPPQVFTLLETLYRSFDEVAAKLKVFKVETIGDSYMAVTGLPVPDENHAVHMARFAYQCLVRTRKMCGDLEALLGPGTSELGLRLGLHSGAVTAGVLRGEKSRFQLFGDTVNTASRMESTGKKGRIQVSQETADLLRNSGKSHWLRPREELVNAKGKGELKTFWLDPTRKRGQKNAHNKAYSSNNNSVVPKMVQPVVPPKSANVKASESKEQEPQAFDEKSARLIDWNVDVLLHHLARVISCRSRSTSNGSLVNHAAEVPTLPAVIDDVSEIIPLPPFDPENSRFRRVRPEVSTLQQTRADLHGFVSAIALMYRDVPFHNFEHASHVTLCANKLLTRLVNSDEYDSEEELHNVTYGISSDPLTHFAIVFSALIHDVDHSGLPNAQLVKDQKPVAIRFNNKSVAEQNSTHIGWELLMDKRFERLRKCIYQTNTERKRFRQLVINSVMATDIADRKVIAQRNLKWERAFRKPTKPETSPAQILESMNRKATAVIEHIMQVSDVAHTMQHWHIYRRWNERLFQEMHNAFAEGKISGDPSKNWYLGEIGFFDQYLIPMANKLKECGVFGASGHEYVSYVLKNKRDWEMKGQQAVQEMIVLCQEVDASDRSDDFDDYGSDEDSYTSEEDEVEFVSA
ncbi:unnamed protein product [Cylindrotheca closterium]|uniref:Phosphodiesterase n=1 Tax=Cylindrotheca closterium TaxID=2856 RepID=A0AAD2FPD1_9STRA|nr:unnamed protein product [Cylindrotheca closterium]